MGRARNNAARTSAGAALRSGGELRVPVGEYRFCSAHGYDQGIYPREDPPAALTYPAGSLLLLMGAPGAGKSTLARRLLADAHVLAIDAVRDELTAAAGGEQASFGEAIDELMRRAARHLDDGDSVVIESVGVRPAMRENMADLARDRGVEVHALLLDATDAECRAGQAERGHALAADSNDAYRARWGTLLVGVEGRCASYLDDGSDRELDSVIVLDRAAAEQLRAITLG